uniref:Uncharacterized protein n=2 Tax=Avena sativa TaxID=4498 RepID=A0ACD5X1A3_AVESA
MPCLFRSLNSTNAWYLFNKMAGRQQSVESWGLDILNIPNDVLEHILSFLSSREAVKTCVLSKSWRYQWKNVPTLQICDTVDNCNKFLCNFLLARHHRTINVCDIQYIDEEMEQMHVMDIWIFHVVTICHVQELIVSLRSDFDFIHLRNEALTSKHLRRMNLHKIHLGSQTADFSSWPSLEDVLINCIIDAKIITSESLKCMTAIDCEFDAGDTRTRISTPSLICLELNEVFSRTPLLEGMPFLEDAYVRFSDVCSDYCQYDKSWACGNEDCDGCSCVHDNKEVSLVLEGLANATNLELINKPRVFTFVRDLRRCPLFKNLKTLMLSECFFTTEPQRLVCILKKSPVLEKLVLLLFEELCLTKGKIIWSNLWTTVLDYP